MLGDDLLHPQVHRVCVGVDLDGGNLALVLAEIEVKLADITVPTLLLFGDADVRSPLSVAEDLHARIPSRNKSQLVVMPGSATSATRRPRRSSTPRSAGSSTPHTAEGGVEH